jgi:uncharacterized membrane protein
MKRDTKIVLAFVGSIPLLILTSATLTAFAISHGASMRWRLLFRLMCHGRPERCLDLFGVPMPICARCTGIYLGLIGGFAVYWLFRRASEKALRVAAFIALTPLAVDGLTQLTGLRESTNGLRVATGLVAGLAFGLWILGAVERRGETAVTAP